MNFLYNTGINLYALGVRLAAGSNPKAAKMLRGHRGVFPTIADKITPSDRPVWIHASSLGEFEQGRPLIERVKREFPERKILLTFFSPSGYEVRKNFPGADCVVYLPFDTKANARRFVDMVNPSMAIFVKYEFWGNYLDELHRRGVPTYLISGIFRPGQVFFKPWGGVFRKMLRDFTHLFVQDDRSKQLLAAIGVTDVTVAGDTRFDRVTDVLRTAADLPEVEAFAGRDERFTLIVGSSWPADEDVYIPWVNSRDDVKVIIAPHEFDRDRLAQLERRIKGKVVRFSAIERDAAAAEGAKVLIVDCFGKLSSIYRYGSVAYVGGGFGTGIHNINEAAVYGIPVLFGPNHAKFKEAADMIACGGGFEVASSGQCGALLDGFAADAARLSAAGAAAGSYIRQNLGATDRIFKHIF